MGGEYKPDLTGTPMFMAISTLQRQEQGESSDLESAFYVFLHWATNGTLHWKHARFEPDFYAQEAIALKWTAMTLQFEEKVLDKISDEKLFEIAKRLQALFFPGNQYNRSVLTMEFLKAINETS